VDREYDLTVDALLEQMDEAQVERAMIAPVDRCLAVSNETGNDLMLHAAGEHPDRLIPTCTANPWYGVGAVAEAERAIGEGARMLVLHPFVQGFMTNDELVWPLLETAAETHTPVYIHTGMPGNATPWQVVDLAERFSGLDLIIGHCGATDFWNDMVEAAKFSDQVYFESSLARPFSFSRYVEQVGSRKGMMGSYAPINGLVFEWDQMRKVLSEDIVAAVCGENLRRLLEKRGDL
jgi:hypothetical protein